MSVQLLSVLQQFKFSDLWFFIIQFLLLKYFLQVNLKKRTLEEIGPEMLLMDRADRA